MTARMYYDNDADPSALAGQTVAIIGYGSQGHAHALNLHESGVDVVVGLKPGSKSRAIAEEAGLRVADVADAVKAADVIMIAVPDTLQKAVYDAEIEPNLRPGQLLMFAHGFNIRFGRIQPPADDRRRDGRPEGPRPPPPLRLRGGRRRAGAVRGRERRDRDGPGARPRLRPRDRLDPRRRPRDDVQGGDRDRPVRRAGAALRRRLGPVKAAFETLVEAGYQPELAYFETMHELKLIVDLMYRGGLNFMRFSVSDTAEYGDYVSGPRVTEGVEGDDEGRPRPTSRAARSRTAGSPSRRPAAPSSARLREQDKRPPDRAGRRASCAPRWPS